jgi:aryl-alcohol dehydrogenase (NADP+)
VARLVEVASGRGVWRAQVDWAWMLSKPVVTAPIIGATKPRHLDDAVAAVDLDLSEREIASLEEPHRPHADLGLG